MEFKYTSRGIQPIFPYNAYYQTVSSMLDETLAINDYRESLRILTKHLPANVATSVRANTVDIADEEAKHLGQFWLQLLAIAESSGDINFFEGVKEACGHFAKSNLKTTPNVCRVFE